MINKKQKIVFQLIFLIALSFFIVNKFSNNADLVVDAIRSISILSILLSLALLSLQIFLSFFSWYQISKIINKSHLPFQIFFSAFFLGNIAKYIPGGIWDQIGKYSIIRKSNSLSKRETLQSIYTHVLMSILATLILATPLLFHLSINRNVVFYALLISIFLVFFYKRIKASSVFKKCIIFMPNLNKNFVFPFFTLILSWLFYALSLLLIIPNKTPVSFEQIFNVIIASPISWTIGFIFPFSPNGLGIRETVLYTGLTNVFLKDDLVAAILVFRFLSIIVDLLMSLFAYIIYRKK